MEKLTRIDKIKLKAILKSCFPNKYIKIRKHEEVIIKSHFFSFKRVVLTVDELLNSILPNYLINVYNTFKTNQTAINFNYTDSYSKKGKINFLYDIYIGVSPNFTKELTDHFIDNLKEKRKFDIVSNTFSIFSFKDFFNKSRNPKDLYKKKLQLMPSTDITTYQNKLLKEKRNLLFKHKYGNISVSTSYTSVIDPTIENSIVTDIERNIKINNSSKRTVQVSNNIDLLN